jgi:predicted SAM-dependent methyltransferase
VIRDLTVVFYDLFLAPLRGGWTLREYVARRAKPLVPKEVYESTKKLNLGSSDRKLPGYVNVDIVADYNPDIVANVNRLAGIGDGEYDLVRASHVLEHFMYDECPQVLAEWRRVLRPGGYLIVCCPDYLRASWRAIMAPHGFDPLSRRYCAAKHQGWIAGLFGIPLPPDLRHKTVFTERSLRALLGQAGFAVLGRQVHQVEHPYTLGIVDDSCSIYSVNLVARKVQQRS